MAIVLGRKPGGSGGGGGAPSGPAGGVLSGTYPDPGFANEPVLESDYDANTVLKADSDNTPVALTMGASTILARLAAGNIVAATPAQIQTLLQELNVNADGWVVDTATWTYASASTFTVTGDRTAVFSRGTRLRFTQTTVKYAVVTGSSHAAGTTTVTIAVNTDYTLANAAISATSYSYAVNPQGYPGTFAYTPVWTSTGTPPAVGSGSLTGGFSMVGRVVTAFIQMAFSSSTNGTGVYSFSLPVAVIGTVLGGSVRLLDAGTARFAGTPINLAAQTVNAIIADATGDRVMAATVPITWANGDTIDIMAEYWAA